MTITQYKNIILDRNLAEEPFIHTQPFYMLLEHVAIRFFLYGFNEPKIEELTRNALLEFYSKGYIKYTFEGI